MGAGRLDLWIAEQLVETKAVEAPLPIHHAQIMSYPKATRCAPGLLINSKVPVLSVGIKRVRR